jgi:hypothetical protein
MFKAILLTKPNADAASQAEVTNVKEDQLPVTGDKDVVVKVD